MMKKCQWEKQKLVMKKRKMGGKIHLKTKL